MSWVTHKQRAPWARATVAGALAATTAACAAVFGFEELTDGPRDSGRPAEDGGPVVIDADPSERCPPPSVPPPPGPDPRPSVPPSTFVIDSLDIGGAAGVNLDGACTTNETQSSCRLSPSQLQFDSWRDGERGVDRAGNVLIAAAGGQAPALRADNVARAVSYGLASVLVELDDWNGADDPQVTVVAFGSLGLEGANEAGATVLARVMPDPSNASERWSTYGAAALAAGYVSGGVLVARFELPLTFPLAMQIIDADAATPAPGTPIGAGSAAGVGGADDERPLALQLRSALLVATIRADDAAIRLQQGVLAGRVGVPDLLLQSAKVRNLAENGGRGDDPFCIGGQLTLDAIYRLTCQGRDVAMVGADDGAEPCDGLAFAAGFTARPAVIGENLAKPLADPCPTFQTTECDGDAGAPKVVMPEAAPDGG